MSFCEECEFDPLAQGLSTAGVVNFGGSITTAGNFLLANGDMQSPTNSEFNRIGNIFYAGAPMQANSIAWNTTNVTTITVLRIWVNTTLVRSLVIEKRAGAIDLTSNPIVLNARDFLQVSVNHLDATPPGPSQVSFYMSPR